MILKEKLNAIATDIATQVEPIMMATMETASQQLLNSGILSRTLKSGDKAPEFTLYDSDGVEFNSTELHANGPLLLCFFRGAWCPFCSAELAALQQALPAIKSTGATFVAISPMLGEHAKEMVDQYQLGFPLLCDPGNQLAAQFGLSYTLAPELHPIYKKYGLDVPRYNGDDSWQLPMPSRIIIDRHGVIRDTDIHLDYTTRPEPEKTIALLKHIAVS